MKTFKTSDLYLAVALKTRYPLGQINGKNGKLQFEFNTEKDLAVKDMYNYFNKAFPVDAATLFQEYRNLKSIIENHKHS